MSRLRIRALCLQVTPEMARAIRFAPLTVRLGPSRVWPGSGGLSPMTRTSQPNSISRRTALRTAGAGMVMTLGAARQVSPVLAQEATPVVAGVQDGLSAEIIETFKGLPGQQGLKLWAPPDAGRPAWSVELHPDER